MKVLFLLVPYGYIIIKIKQNSQRDDRIADEVYTVAPIRAPSLPPNGPPPCAVVRCGVVWCGGGLC